MAVRGKAEECFHQLELLCDAVGQIDDGGNVFFPNLGADDLLARYRLWAANIGVFAKEHASLDYRLKENETAMNVTITLLGSLSDMLQSAIRVVQSDQIEGRDSTDLESLANSSLSSFHGTETDSAVIVATETINSLEQGLEKAIDRLYRLSRMIRLPSIANQNFKAEKVEITDEEGNKCNFYEFVLEMVNRECPKASDALKEKLARGIVIRRKIFIYRQQHQRKLSTSNVAIDQQEPKRPQKASLIRGARTIPIDTATMAQRSDTIPHNPKSPSQTTASVMTKKPIPLQQIMDDEESNASTTFTHTFNRSSLMDVLAPPRLGECSKEFECRYCCMILPIKRATTLSWRKHVLRDLEPYVCVFEGCTEDGLFFWDQESWKMHMLKTHKCHWQCNSLAHEPCSFNTEEDFDEHMWSAHEGTFTELQLPLLRRSCKVHSDILFTQCPLCGFNDQSEEFPRDSGDWEIIPASQAEVDKKNSGIIAKHLASHLEYISTRALPWGHNEEEEPAETVNSDVVTLSNDDQDSIPALTSDSLATLISEQNKETSWSPHSSEDPDLERTRGGPYEEEWGFIRRSIDQGTSPFARDLLGPRLPAYHVPVEEDKNFFARTHALQMIKDNLLSNPLHEINAKPATSLRCFAVYGPGGIGKTQIAAHFVSSHRQHFDAILWAHAENTTRLFQDFKEMAVSLGLVSETSADAYDLTFTRDILKRWLVNPIKDARDTAKSKSERASWLLVFDGVERSDILNQFWPYDAPGSVLITSRNPYSWAKSLELEPFSLREATDYLMHITGRGASAQDRPLAVEIAKRLGGLPLALAQMGSIIVHESLSFSEFLSTFNENKGLETLLQWPTHDGKPSTSQYQYSLASVWAFDSLTKGMPLLKVLSMLDPEGIPESLFSPTSSPGDIPELADVQRDFKDARDELLARSLVTRNKRGEVFIIHRLVQDVMRTRLLPNELRQVFITAVKLVSAKWVFEKFEWRHGNKRWPRCEDLITHVQRLKDLFPEIAPSTDTSENFEFARLLVDAGWYRHERGRSDNAIQFSNMAQSICESLKLRFLEDPEYASNESLTLVEVSNTLTEITHNRGCMALEMNDPVNALKYHLQFNKMMIRELGSKDNHHDMRFAISWNELGNSYMLNQDWSAGEECFRKSIVEMRRLVNFKPTNVSLPIANLGLSYWLQGKHDIALKTLLDGLKEREREFGVNDQESFITGRFFHGIGNVYQSQGRMVESLDYHRRALEHYKQTLGTRHHRTADVFVKVAEHHIRMQQYEVALDMLARALEAYSSSTVFRPELMRTFFKRAKALRAFERFEEADSELSKCFALYGPIMKEKIRIMKDRAGQTKMRQIDLEDDDVDACISFRSR